MTLRSQIRHLIVFILLPREGTQWPARVPGILKDIDPTTAASNIRHFLETEVYNPYYRNLRALDPYSCEQEISDALAGNIFEGGRGKKIPHQQIKIWEIKQIQQA